MPSEPPVSVAADDLLESYKCSLWLQEMRIGSLQQQLRERSIRVHGLEQSLSWRITLPIRTVRALASGRLASGVSLSDVAQKLRDIGSTEGIRGFRKRVLRYVPGSRQSDGVPPARPIWEREVLSRPRLTDRLLIVAELSVPQCAKYRVWQKQEMCGRIDWPCTVIDWHETEAIFTALQVCTRVIFYRVPGYAHVLAMIAEARRLGLQPAWEVDDLIFDEALFARNSNIAGLPPALRQELISGIHLYRAAMLACPKGVASTRMLAQAMRDAGVAEVAFVENALDAETLRAAAPIRAARLPSTDGIVIVYGSGSKTHDADFALAAPAIERLLRKYSSLRLRIVGELSLPKTMDEFAGQIQTLPGTDYLGYLKLLSEGDISIAPLEATLFNDAKSNIKYQEAAILGIPSVCSPRDSFAGAITPERNGLLAETSSEWERALERLIRDPELRARLGAGALRDVLEQYAPGEIARAQLLPLLGPSNQAPPSDAAPSRNLRVLAVNVYFWPNSFGGATIVAEQLARRLHVRADTEISVFTSRADHAAHPDAMLRHDWDGIPVFATPLPPGGDSVAGFDNPAAVRHFASVLDAVRPDVVHAHSIQGFGAGVLRLCYERGIPYVITLHDAWFVCERQFMVRGDGKYCFQTSIDLAVCQACVPHARHLRHRETIMQQVLQNAAALLSPSSSHRALYLANGIADEQIGVNRNGVVLPGRARTMRRPGSPVRFGFVGGAVPIKGFNLIKQAFETIWSRAENQDWQLVLVDNTLNLGFSTIDVTNWNCAANVRVIAAYAQEELDDFFDRIDVLLFPSQWKESYGLTVREALARDVWVIATTPGGQADDITEGVNGRLIPLDGKADGLTAAIEEILHAPNRLDQYVNPGRLNIPDYAEQTEQLHEVLVQAASKVRQANPRSRDSSA